MSGIFGIYNLNGQPINKNDLHKMATATNHRGPDRTKLTFHKYVAMGHCMLCTTPESLNELLPYTDNDSGLTITADARIDNREELARSLGTYNISSISDSQLILLAFKKWGTNCFKQLLGDFAFVIWDSRKHQLFCVRDFIGVKPLYYTYTHSHFIFSSEIKAIVQHLETSFEINESIIGEYLTFSLCSNHETLFKNINRLPPAHYLTITRNSKTCTKYWSFESNPQIHYKNSSEYSEHFFEIFRQAVQSKLRSNTNISVEVSGGLDSSSVIMMAQSILGSDANERLTGYAMTFPGLQFDEQIYIEAVSKNITIPIRYIDSSHYKTPDWCQQIKDAYELPDTPNISMRRQLLQNVVYNKSRVLLSGIGGDEWLSGSGYPYLDFLKFGLYKRFFNEFCFSFSNNRRFTLKRISVNLLWPLIPLKLKKILSTPKQKYFPEWIPETFISQIKLSERIQQADSKSSLSNLSNLSLYNVLTKGFETYFLETMDRYHAKFGIEYRSPFLDRRIAEFSKAIPEFEIYQKGQIKYLLRNQHYTQLPDLIRDRSDKADFSFFFGKAFASKQFKNSMRNCKIKEKQWVHSKKLQDKVREKQRLFENNNFHSGNMTWEVWFAFAIEMWYETLFTKNKKRLE